MSDEACSECCKDDCDYRNDSYNCKYNELKELKNIPYSEYDKIKSSYVTIKLIEASDDYLDFEILRSLKSFIEDYEEMLKIINGEQENDKNKNTDT